ncbi:hypothetical protein ACFOHT_22690 [Massilia oculi]|uniref:hypothetical protein n=1 Tax=Massilia oculi TaxID=945844 RepID=UPI0013B44876|nr:hypothetical protein [Massilia oculi]
MMRRPAARTVGFTRWASAISASGTGSSKPRHHCWIDALPCAPARVFSEASEPPSQPASAAGISGRSKSGPAAVQAPSSAAPASASAFPPDRLPGAAHTATPAPPALALAQAAPRHRGCSPPTT